MKFNDTRLYKFVQKNRTELFCVICFLAVYLELAIVMMPLSSPFSGHDTLYHYLRVESLKYNIETGNLFSGIDYLYFDGAGYAGFAYPQLFLYIPALLRVMGVGIGTSMSIFLLICSAFAYLFMFLFLKEVSGNPYCATIGAVLYFLCGYRLDNMFVRFALGEVEAFVFWPIVLWGLYDLVFGDFKRPYIIGIGIAGMLMCHSISTALALILCVLFVLIFIARILRNPKKLLKLLATAGCVVAVTSFYWLPLLEFLGSAEMSVKNTAYHTVDYQLPILNLFKEVAHNRIAGLGVPIFLPLILRLFLMKGSPIAADMYDENTGKRGNLLALADAFAILGVVFALLSTDIVPWEFLSKFLDFMQFPWRFFAPASISLITAGTIYIFQIVKYTKVVDISVLVITLVAVGIAGIHLGISEVRHKEYRADDYYSVTEGVTIQVGSGEWLPRAANFSGVNEARAMGENVTLSDGELVPCERENGTLTFELEKPADYVIAPYIWYKGYTATDENGTVLEVSMSENGLVKVDLTNAAGTIVIQHKPTVIKVVSYIISAISIIAIAAAFAIRRRRKSESEISSPEQ